MDNEKRLWTVLDDRFGNDLGPFTTKTICDYAAERNAENQGESDYVPFRLLITDDRIWDIGGREASVVATRYNGRKR
jgi:hypothetical protein